MTAHANTTTITFIPVEKTLYSFVSDGFSQEADYLISEEERQEAALFFGADEFAAISKQVTSKAS